MKNYLAILWTNSSDSFLSITRLRKNTISKKIILMFSYDFYGKPRLDSMIFGIARMPSDWYT